jgi:hypothetical protein
VISLPHTPPTTVDHVLENLHALRAQLPRGDGVRYFNRLYIGVTREVRVHVADGRAEDPAFIVGLDVAFADSYFDAVRRAEDGPRAAPPAWRPLFEARTDRTVAPIQLVLAGMNAHINFDLPVQIVATSAAQGVVPNANTPQFRDFQAMGNIFQRVEDRARRWLLTGILRKLDRLLGRVDDAVAIWSLMRAREAAWSNAMTLWHLRDDEGRVAKFLDTLAHTTGAFGRGLVLPSTVGIERWLDRLRPP